MFPRFSSFFAFSLVCCTAQLVAMEQEAANAALIKAVYNKNEACVTRALQGKANPNIQTKQGIPVAALALVLGNGEIAWTLFKRGAKKLSYDWQWHIPLVGDKSTNQKFTEEEVDKKYKEGWAAFKKYNRDMEELKTLSDLSMKHQPSYCLLNNDGTYPEAIKREWDRRVNDDYAAYVKYRG